MTSQANTAQPCRWCGRMYGEHVDPRRPGVPVPRVPCLLLKSGFHPRGLEPAAKSDPVAEAAAENLASERQDFVDRAAIASLGGLFAQTEPVMQSPGIVDLVFDAAEALWEERERRRAR